MKVLIVHHLEPMWEASLIKLSGKDCFEWCLNVRDHIEENGFDKVILTQFEDWKAQDVHIETGLADYVSEWHDYGYGWEPDMFLNENEYVEGGSHSEVVHTPEWIKGLKGSEVHLCGAFDGECIEDMEIALSACVGEFTRIENLIC